MTGILVALIVRLVRLFGQIIEFRCVTMQLGKAKDRDQLKAAIENYQTILRSSTNPKNLKKFVESFLK